MADQIHPQHAMNALGRALDMERSAHAQTLVRESVAMERVAVLEQELSALRDKTETT